MLKRILPVVLTIAVAFMLAGCEKRMDDFYQKAVTYYNQKKFTEATLEIKNALALDPECGKCRLLFGKLALEEGNFQGAFVNFRYAVDFAPELVEAKVELSKLYLLAGEFEDAGDTARNALNLDAANIEARLVLASVLAEKKKYSESEKMLEIARTEAPDNPDVYLSMNSVYVRQEKLDKAEKALLEGIARIPGNVPLLMKTVAFYRQTDRPEMALGYVEKLLEVGSGDPRTELFAAEYYSSVGRTDKALELMAGVVSRVPENVDYRVLYSRLLNSEEKFDLTEKILKEGLALDNTSVQLRSALAGLYMAQGRQEEASRVLLEGIELDPEGADNVLYRKRLATMFLDMNEPGRAIQQLDEVIQFNPKDTEAHFLRGQIYLLEGKGQLAVAEFRQVVRDNPESAPAYVLLSKAHLINDEVSIAIENLKEAIKLDPGYAPAREALINTYLDRKDWHQAILELQRLRDKRPDDLNIMAAIGDVYAIKGDINLANHSFTELAEKHPESPVGLLKLAELARMQGKLYSAERYYTQALDVAPDSLAAIQGKVSALIAQNKYTAAIKFCEKLLEKFPDNARIYEILGQVHAKRGNFEEAEMNYSRALTLAPQWMLPYMRIGDLYVSNGKIKDGIAKFEEEVKKDAQNPGPQFILGLLYDQAGDYDKSRAVYSALLQKNPGFYLAANNLAYLLATKFSDNGDDMQEALKLARIAASSQSPEALDTLGYVLYLNKDYEQALHILNSALQLDPDFSAAQFHKALVYYREGKKTEARKILTALVNSSDDFPERKEAVSLLERL